MRRATIVALGTALALAGCGGRSAYPAPADPTAAVRSFLDAVRANSITAMADLWGSSRGPASSYMDRRQMEQRLTVMQRYLRHERYDFVTGNAEPGDAPDRRVVRVRLFRNGCEPVVPFTMIQHRGGWLVWEVDLAAAGNPERACPGN